MQADHLMILLSTPSCLGLVLVVQKNLEKYLNSHLLEEIPEEPEPDTKNKNNPLVSKKDRKLMESGHIRDLTKISGKLFLFNIYSYPK